MKTANLMLTSLVLTALSAGVALADDMAKLCAQIDQHGCFLKDIDLGLVDFPGEVDNQVVFLCWQFGEQRISAWHEIESGFSGRRPLSGAPKPYLN